jgi:hypothetical protein
MTWEEAIWVLARHEEIANGFALPILDQRQRSVVRIFPSSGRRWCWDIQVEADELIDVATGLVGPIEVFQGIKTAFQMIGSIMPESYSSDGALDEIATTMLRACEHRWFLNSRIYLDATRVVEGNYPPGSSNPSIAKLMHTTPSETGISNRTGS